MCHTFLYIITQKIKQYANIIITESGDYMNYGYQPYTYQPYLNQYGNYQGYNQIQNQIPTAIQQQALPQPTQPQVQSQQNTLQGWYVDSVDVTKGINADMSGNAMFFPSTDGKEIYKKQLDVSSGKSITYVYKIFEDTDEKDIKQELDFSPIYSQINSIKTELSKEMSEIKEMVLESITTPQVNTKKVGGKF